MKRYLSLVLILLIIACQEQNISPDKKEKPALKAIAGHNYWYFFRGEDHKTLRYAYSNDGSTWYGNGSLNNGSASSEGPAAVYFDGWFYSFFKGSTTTNLYYCYSQDGINWYDYIQIPVVATGKSPAAVVWNNELYVFFTGASGYGIYYIKTSDGTNWTSQQLALSSAYSVSSGVSAAVKPGTNELYVAYSRRLNSVFNDTGLNFIVASSADSNGNPVFSIGLEVLECGGSVHPSDYQATGASLAFYNDTLLFAYAKDWGGDLVVLRLGTCGGLKSGSYSVNARTSHRPGFVNRNGRLTLAYKSLSDGLIRYSHSDDGGFTWYGDAAASGDSGGSISLIGG